MSVMIGPGKSIGASQAHRYVSVDGPYSDFNRDGDEVPEWTVCIADDDGEPVGRIYRCRSLTTARQLGDRMARDRRMELVDEASPA